MKYYVIERKYDLKNRIVKENLITGYTTCLSWAEERKEYCFNERLIQYRHSIKPGDVHISDMVSTLGLKDGKYEVRIETVKPQPKKKPFNPNIIIVIL